MNAFMMLNTTAFARIGKASVKTAATACRETCASSFVTALGVFVQDTCFPLGTVRLGSGSSFTSTAGATVVSDGVFMFLRVVIEIWNCWGGVSV